MQMDYYKKYIKYKSKYTKLTIKQTGGSNDYTNLKPAFLEYYEKRIGELNEEKEEVNKIISLLKQSDATLNENNSYFHLHNKDDTERYTVSINMFHQNHKGLDVDANSEIYKMISEKDRNLITTLFGVTKLEQLKGCVQLKKIKFDEFFSYGGEVIIQPGDIPDTIEEMYFWFDTIVTIKKGALPKNLRRFECGSRTFIEGPMPECVKFIDCKQGLLDRKNVVYYSNTLEKYNDDLKNNKLPKNITDLGIYGDMIGNIDEIPLTVENLIIMDNEFNKSNLKFLTISNKNYGYKDKIPKNIMVSYGDVWNGF